VLVVELAADGEGRTADLPVYPFPEQAATALAHAVEYGRRRGAADVVAPDLPGVRRDEAAALLAVAGAPQARWLGPEDVAALCACWGIPLVASHAAADADGAAAIAATLGGRVVLNANAADLVHKTDVGAVRLGLEGADAVRRAAIEMGERLASAGVEVEGFVVQPHVEVDVEMLVGVVQDQQFGPVVAVGAGGTRAEVERDLAVRLTPVGLQDAHEAIRSLRTFPLLDGWRGAPRADVRALEDLVVRTAAMADAHPHIHELDFNPVAAGAHGAVVLDARVRAGPVAPAQPWPAVGTTPPRARDAA
jgi:acyl-CoA synthetase (NDP forming)